MEYDWEKLIVEYSDMTKRTHEYSRYCINQFRTVLGDKRCFELINNQIVTSKLPQPTKSIFCCC